jgi:hypothetical protein
MWGQNHSQNEGVKPARSPGRFPLGTPLDKMKDTLFDALANEHRRNLLVALLDENPQDAVVSDSADVDVGPLKTRHRLRTAMHHHHLPKLDDYGFVEWQTDTQEVHRGPQFEEIRPLLEYIDDTAPSQSW